MAEEGDRETPLKHLHEWKSPFQPGGKQANTAKARPLSRDLGSREKKNGPFLNSMLSEA